MRESHKSREERLALASLTLARFGLSVCFEGLGGDEDALALEGFDVWIVLETNRSAAPTQKDPTTYRIPANADVEQWLIPFCKALKNP